VARRPQAAAGRDPRGEEEGNFFGDDWHKIHAINVKKTHAYLQDPSTPSNLIIMLKCMEPAHCVMRWLMHNESDVRRLSVPHDDLFSSRRQVAIQWVSPRVSPVWSALASGTLLLSDQHREGAVWGSALAYNVSSVASLRLKIMRALLPVLARIWQRARGSAVAWPLKLIRLLSECEAGRHVIAEEFLSTSSCCMPQGVKPLHKSVSSVQEILAPDFIKLVEELAAQIDFSNFDQELNHSSMRASLQATSGKSMGFDTAALLHMGADISRAHSHMDSGKPPQLQRGRPRASSAKRKRFDAWNAFVQMQPVRSESKQDDIRSGSHLKALGQKWAELSPGEKQKYQDIASAVQMQNRCNEAAEVADDLRPPRDDAEYRGPWGLGTKGDPLSPDLMKQPEFDGQLNDVIENWLQGLRSPLPHLECLPYTRTVYENVCVGLCKTHPAFDEAKDMRDRWLRVFARVDVCQAFIVIGESQTELFSACFLVAHRQDKPVNTILIPLEPCDFTCAWALDTCSNFPWSLGLKVHLAEDSRKHVEFLHDMSFFGDVCTRAQQLGVRDIVARRLDFELTSMDTLRVKGLENMKSISSSVLDDMASLTALDKTLAQGEDCLNDLHELREVGPLPRRAQQTRDDAAGDGDGDHEGFQGEHDEYSFESELAAGARMQVARILADVEGQDTLIESARRCDPVGAVDVDAGMSADEVRGSGSSSSSSNPAACMSSVPLDAVDFASFAQYLHRVPGKNGPRS
jgi:hypothetical protein